MNDLADRPLTLVDASRISLAEILRAAPDSALGRALDRVREQADSDVPVYSAFSSAM